MFRTNSLLPGILSTLLAFFLNLTRHTEAFLWGQKAAEAGMAKAMYAVGYFLEVGIGTIADMQQ